MRVVDVDEMKSIEKSAIDEFGFTEELIIENVGIRAADFIEKKYLLNTSGESDIQEVYHGEIIFLIGRGNNGADALAVARNLANRGYQTRAFMLFPDEEYTTHLSQQVNLAEKFGVKISDVRNTEFVKSYFTQAQDEYLVVDGVLGTGFRSPISNYLFEIFNVVNEYATYIIAVDIPSGIEGTSGAISSTAILADTTITIGLPKLGHFISDGAKQTGVLKILESGFPQKVLEGGDKTLLRVENVGMLKKGRNKFAHKNNFGHCLLVGGSQGLCGALIMASNAALKVGTGLVTSVTWEDNFPQLSQRISPEIMTAALPNSSNDWGRLEKYLTRYSSVVVGPGLGQSNASREVVLGLLEKYDGPLVIDADGLNVLNFEEDQELFQKRTGITILTPHMGEFARLTGHDAATVSTNPIKYLRELVDRSNSCVLLKDACTYLGLPNGEVLINYYPNDGMASGGSGDVLAGILGGLVSQCLTERNQTGIFKNNDEIYASLCLGVVVHSRAGKFAADKLGARAMTANSIVDNLSEAFFEVNTYSFN